MLAFRTALLIAGKGDILRSLYALRHPSCQYCSKKNGSVNSKSASPETKNDECENFENKSAERLSRETPIPSKILKGKSAEELMREAQIPEPPDKDPEFDSDVDNYWNKWKTYNDWKRSQSKHGIRPNVNPKETSVLLFPGQGAHFVGMGKQLLEYSNVQEMYEIASNILGYDLLKVCLNGPKHTLESTVVQQPALLVTSIAAVEKLRSEQPWAIESCVGAAGFSIGEYAALVFGGAMTFEDAVTVVKARAEAMQTASQAAPSGMMSVLLRADAKVKFACHTARRYCHERVGIEQPVCSIANYLFPEGKVLAGHMQALEFIEKNAKEFGIRKVKFLPVSGAFHTRLMYPAKEALAKALEKIEISPPIIPVYSNVNTYKYQQANVIRRLLAEQVFSSVKWEQIMHVVYSRPRGEDFPETYEVGPGQHLGVLLKQTNAHAFARYHKVDV